MDSVMSANLKLRGTVTGGNKIGRRLGFPTANILVGNDLDARDGVYSAIVRIGEESYSGMAFLGRKPSVSGDGPRVLEANIFDFSDDLYDREIEVELVQFIREERRFDTFDELREQIREDKDNILKL